MREGVWTHGEDTGFEAWVGEKTRKVIVTREAVEDYLGLDPVRAAAMSVEERRVFVMDNLAVMIAAANKDGSSGRERYRYDPHRRNLHPLRVDGRTRGHDGAVSVYGRAIEITRTA